MIQIFWKLVAKQTSYFLVQVCKGQKKIPQKNFSILLSGTKVKSSLLQLMSLLHLFVSRMNFH